MNDLISKPVAELAKLLSNGEVSSVSLTQAYIDRVKAIDGKVSAFNSFDQDDALKQAQTSDERRAAGRPHSPLDGIPVGLKNVIAVNGQPLTCSSKMLENFVSPYDAHVTERLKAAGLVLWGRLNMDEFAMGSSTENSAFGTTSNPWDLERIPGGSSGGSAACLAASEAPWTLGSDTGGSIRQPAALCGVVGMKPSYGLVSRYGLVAFASSLDQIGPFTRTVEDAAIMLQLIAGHDTRDSTSFKTEIPDYRAELDKRTGPWKIGVPKEYFGEGLGDEVRQHLDKAIAFYREQGCEIVEVSLPHTELAVPVYYIIATAEASSNLARYDGIRYTHRTQEANDAVDLYFKTRAEAFGQEVKRRIILGTYVLSSGYYDAYYKRAQQVRSLIRQDFMHAFQNVDVLLTPTTPTPAFKKGEKTANPLEMYLSDIYTINVNLAGLPGVSVPCGFSEHGLPVGMQLIGKPFDEAGLLAVAHAYDKVHRYGTCTPSL